MSRLTLLTLILLLPGFIFAQLYEGPASGTTKQGVSVSTDDFSLSKQLPAGLPKLMMYNKFITKEYPNPPDLTPPAAPEEANFVRDRSFYQLEKQASISNRIQFESFEGIEDIPTPAGFISIPPDPYIAAGPEHLMQVVNTRFRITDKQGNELKSIWAENWFGTLGIEDVSPFDCKVIYDQISERWVMVWLHINDNTSEAYFLLSVSDDSNPLGTWYNWALSSTIYGTTPSGRWADYPGIGYDDKAIYITSNEFTFSGSAPGTARIRIIPKSEAYSNSTDAITFKDLYNIKYPDDNVDAFGIRPSRMYSSADGFYLLVDSRYTTKTSIGVYELTDPLGTPSLAGIIVPVTQYSNPPNADQLGDEDTLAIDGGISSVFRSEPIFKDGVMYAVHSVASGPSDVYSAVRYLVLDVFSGDVLVDVKMGQDGYWYFYPALAIDANDNAFISFSRSGWTEYPGAYYTIIPSSTGIPMGSFVMKEGESNYVRTHGGSRNRWGDYVGAWTDPIDPLNVWLMSEYSADETYGSTIGPHWGNWVTGVRAEPYEGTVLVADDVSIFTGYVEKNHVSNEYSTKLRNYGAEDVVIQNIQSEAGPFKLASAFNYPVTLSSFDSLSLAFTFAPEDTGYYQETFEIQSNDPSFAGITLTGRGYFIYKASPKVLYASSDGANNGDIFILDKNSGAGSLLGNSLFESVTSITVDPISQKLYGLSPGEGSTNLIGINAAGGDSYTIYSLEVDSLYSLAFDINGILYASKKSGEIYTVDPGTSETTFITSSKININAMTFHPATNELYATRPSTFGKPKDLIFTVDVSTGDTVSVGKTGRNSQHNALTFDESGLLYLSTEQNFKICDLITYNLATGETTILGSTEIKGVSGLAYLTEGGTDVDNTDPGIPENYSLSQNYPNPFNPSTTIKFSLPVVAKVTINIYNLIGQKIAEIFDGTKPAGFHEVIWNSADTKNISSGIYFYEIRAEGADGSKYVNTQKMVLMK